MKERRKIIIVGLVIVLIFGGIAALFFFSPRPVADYQTEPPAEKEMFGLAGRVLEINTEGSFLIVKSDKDGKTFKAFVGKDTDLLKIELPDNYSEKGYVVTAKTQIGLADFQKGDYVSLRTRENIAGKAEFAGIIHIYLYPFVASPDED